MIYKLLDQPVSTEMLGVWEKHMFHFDRVFGYTATGTIFLFSSTTNEYLVFYPLMQGNNCKNYGEFASIKAFEEKVLKEESFSDYGLYPINKDDLVALEAKLGTLGDFEIYYPALDPALGGSLKLDGFGKGNIWVRTEILGMNRGVE